MSPIQSAGESSGITRRRFLTGTSATVAGFMVAEASLVRGAEANSRIDIGLIGCGGRGRWIAELFQQHGGYNLVGLADYFQEQVDGAAEKLKVPEAKRFTGLSAYRKLLEQKLDAVVIESPPYFHPEQAAAAVDAGKHVYLAKPIAVDVPGCRTVEASGRKAAEKKLSFLVDFQTRASKVYQDAVQKVREGELGKVISAEASYHCGPTWDNMDKILQKNPQNPETRLRAWGVDRKLSGDVITEQNIHAIDVACWILDAQPIRAVGTGGRRRDFYGDCWDQFAVIYYFPGDIVLSFNSHQSGFGYDDIMCRVFGMKGTIDTHYFGRVTFKGQEFRSDLEVGNLYTTGAVANIAAFHKSVTSGDCSNLTVPQSVRSNLATILGRMASYRKGAATWDEMMSANEKFSPDLAGLKA